jgi:hypothetical protein
MIAVLLLLACPKPVAPTEPYLPPFERAEPEARPDLPPLAPGSCDRAFPFVVGDVMDCNGSVIPATKAEELRLDAADLAFWEDDARACRRYRETDRALCNGRVAVLESTTVEQDQALRRARTSGDLAFAAGVGLGAGVTVLIAFALDAAAQ